MSDVKRSYECFDVRMRDGTTVVLVKDPQKLGRLLGDDLRREFTDLAWREKPKKLVIDLGAVQYCTSELIESLLYLRRLVQSSGGRVRFCGVRGRVAEVFQTLKLSDSPLGVDGSLAESLAALWTPHSLPS